jgi:hypothetical protein
MRPRLCFLDTRDDPHRPSRWQWLPPHLFAEGTAEGQVLAPSEMAVADGVLYVADRSSNQRIVSFWLTPLSTGLELCPRSTLLGQDHGFTFPVRLAVLPPAPMSYAAPLLFALHFIERSEGRRHLPLSPAGRLVRFSERRYQTTQWTVACGQPWHRTRAVGVEVAVDRPRTAVDPVHRPGWPRP